MDAERRDVVPDLQGMLKAVHGDTVSLASGTAHTHSITARHRKPPPWRRYFVQADDWTGYGNLSKRAAKREVHRLLAQEVGCTLYKVGRGGFREVYRYETAGGRINA